MMNIFYYLIRGFLIYIDQIKKNKVGRICGIFGGQERCIQEFGGVKPGK